MSYSISTLLIRNLDDVFGEIDPARRRAAIDEIFHEDAAYHDRNGVFRGRDEIQRIAGVYRASHPELQYQQSAPPEEVGDGGRLRWVSCRPGFALVLCRDPFHHRPGRPDCRRLSFFRPATLSAMSACGTKRTFNFRPAMSAFGGKADIN
jgi:hypothetical protein